MIIMVTTSGFPFYFLLRFTPETMIDIFNLIISIMINYFREVYCFVLLKQT